MTNEARIEAIIRGWNKRPLRNWRYATLWHENAVRFVRNKFALPSDKAARDMIGKELRLRANGE